MLLAVLILFSLGIAAFAQKDSGYESLAELRAYYEGTLSRDEMEAAERLLTSYENDEAFQNHLKRDARDAVSMAKDVIDQLLLSHTVSPAQNETISIGKIVNAKGEPVNASDDFRTNVEDGELLRRTLHKIELLAWAGIFYDCSTAGDIQISDMLEYVEYICLDYYPNPREETGRNSDAPPLIPLDYEQISQIMEAEFGSGYTPAMYGASEKLTFSCNAAKANMIYGILPIEVWQKQNGIDATFLVTDAGIVRMAMKYRFRTAEDRLLFVGAERLKIAEQSGGKPMKKWLSAFLLLLLLLCSCDASPDNMSRENEQILRDIPSGEVIKQQLDALILGADIGYGFDCVDDLIPRDLYAYLSCRASGFFEIDGPEAVLNEEQCLQILRADFGVDSIPFQYPDSPAYTVTAGSANEGRGSYRIEKALADGNLVTVAVKRAVKQSTHINLSNVEAEEPCYQKVIYQFLLVDGKAVIQNATIA